MVISSIGRRGTCRGRPSAGRGEHSTSCRHLTAGEPISFALQPRTIAENKSKSRDCRHDDGERDKQASACGEGFYLAPESVRPEAEGCRPRGGAQAAEQHEPVPVHPIDARQQPRQRPKKRDEARHEDQSAAVARKQVPAEPEIALVNVKVTAVPVKEMTFAVAANRVSRDATAER